MCVSLSLSEKERKIQLFLTASRKPTAGLLGNNHPKRNFSLLINFLVTVKESALYAAIY